MLRLLHVVGALYEAAHGASRWPDALLALAKLVGADAGVMMARARADGGFAPIAEFGTPATQAATVDSPPGARSRCRSPRWRPCHDGDPVAATNLCCVLPGKAGAPEIVVVLELPVQAVPPRGGVRRLDRLVPHLCRALALHWEVVRRRRADLCNALAARHNCGALVIADSDGYVVATTAVADERLWQSGQRESILPSDLRKLVASVAKDGKPTARPWFVSGVEHWAIGRPVPPEQTRDCAFSAPVVAIALASGARPPPETPVLRQLFQLTEAEALLTQALLAGAALDEIARQTGVSRHTVRTQLNSVMKKCHVNRQAELVALIGRVPAGEREQAARIPQAGVSTGLTEDSPESRHSCVRGGNFFVASCSRVNGMPFA